MTRLDPTVRIAISVEAFEAIARTLPLGSVGYEAGANEQARRSSIRTGLALRASAFRADRSINLA
jgi:hypothetical protein